MTRSNFLCPGRDAARQQRVYARVTRASSAFTRVLRAMAASQNRDRIRRGVPPRLCSPPQDEKPSILPRSCDPAAKAHVVRRAGRGGGVMRPAAQCPALAE
jgi:hypothetical protein